jgi:hypothetical protein
MSEEGNEEDGVKDEGKENEVGGEVGWRRRYEAVGTLVYPTIGDYLEDFKASTDIKEKRKSQNRYSKESLGIRIFPDERLLHLAYRHTCPTLRVNKREIKLD